MAGLLECSPYGPGPSNHEGQRWAQLPVFLSQASLGQSLNSVLPRAADGCADAGNHRRCLDLSRICSPEREAGDLLSASWYISLATILHCY